jgi:hypothetical protein
MDKRTQGKHCYVVLEANGYGACSNSSKRNEGGKPVASGVS